MRIHSETAVTMTEGTVDAASNGVQEMVTVYTDDTLANSVLASMDTLRQAGQLCDCVLRVRWYTLLSILP